MDAARFLLLDEGRKRGIAYSDMVKAIFGDNLLAYWRGEEASGDVADNYEGTAARDGAYIGVTLGEDGIGDGLTCPLYDGSNDYTTVFSTSLRDAFNYDLGCIATWVKFSAGVLTDSTTRNLFMLAESPSGNYFYVRFRKESTNNTLRYFRNDGTGLINQTFTHTSYAWFNILMTWSVAANELKCYVAGEQVGSTQTGLASDAGPIVFNNCLIGATSVVPVQPHSGWLAHSFVAKSIPTLAQIGKIQVL